MRNVLTIFLLFLFWSCTSCNSNGSKSDSDSISDKDSVDADVQDAAPDEKTDPDMTSDNEPPDVDEDVDFTIPCLDLKIQANVIKTGFPFKDKNGKPTFCRPGCSDIPTETDPQCVRNIWEWDNWEKYQKYLAAEKEDPNQEWERECYPWPCKLTDMNAYSGEGMKSKCDRIITVNGYEASMGDVWTHGLSDGVAGMLLSRGAIEYDPEKDEFTKIGQAAAMLSYNKGRYVFPVYDRSFDTDDYRSFIISVEKKNGKYYYEFIYNNDVNNSFMSNPSFAGDKWVLIQVRPGKKSSNTDVKYAKAGVWEWHSLNIGKVQEGNIVDDRLSFIINDGVNDRQVFYCDLSKYPKSFNDCTRVTRKLDEGGYELGHSPRIDEDDKTRLIYYLHASNPSTLVEVKFEEGKEPKHTEYETGRLMQPEKVKGKIMMFTGLDDDLNFMGCWYRFDKKKSYCPVTHDWVSQDMAFATFTEKWQIYKGSVSFTLRDMDCYCKEEGVCPFEE